MSRNGRFTTGAFYRKFANKCRISTRTGEKTDGAYLVSNTGIVSDSQQAGTGALLIINNYILDSFWGNICFFYLILTAKMKLEECQPEVQKIV